VILTCPTCRQRSRHPPNQMLGRWAICPHCAAEIDWRDSTRPQLGPSIATPNDNEENER